MIAFDLDGVISDTGPVIRECFLRDHGFDISKDRTRHNVEIPGLTGAEVSECIRRYISTDLLEAQPLNCAPSILAWFYQQTGRPTLIVTARHPEKDAEATHTWLKKNLIAPYEVIFTPGRKKHEALKERGVRFFVDDRFKNIESIAPHVEMAFLYNQPWNQGRSPAAKNVIRVNDLGGVAHFFRKKFGLNTYETPKFFMEGELRHAA